MVPQRIVMTRGQVADGSQITASLAARAYPAVVNFAVCPDDGARLKAVKLRPPPPLLACPACGKQFHLTDQGIVVVPESGGGDPEV